MTSITGEAMDQNQARNGLPDAPPMRFTMTEDGVRIAYLIAGEGPPCIWCCGPEGSHTQLMWSLPTIRRDNYRVSSRTKTYWFDWRGTGLSGPSDGFSIQTHVRDLEAMADVVGGPFALFGGFGSPMAILPFAAKHPDKVSRIVLYAAGVRPYSRGPQTARAPWQKLLADEPSVAQKVLTRSLVSWEDESLTDWDRFYAGLDLRYMDVCQQEISRTDVSEFVPEVTCPVLIIQGRDLRWPTKEMAIELASAFPAGELLLLDGNSYNLTGAAEDPIPHILEFLGRDRGDQHGAASALPAGAMLSQREIEVLRLVAGGCSNKRVAAELGLSVSTVDRHVANIYGKAGLHNRAEAATWAVAHGVLPSAMAT